MRNCSFNLFGMDSNMCAWEEKKKKEYVVSHATFIIFV